ncbi:MAG: TMEM175 family protein [Leptolyngbyaceae cyanobacterium]
MELQRLARLSDLIFAVAMTLMALTFDPLPLKEMTAQEFTGFLKEQLPSFGSYIFTFIAISFYWTSHLHQFKHYKQTDSIHLWLVLLSLLFVVFLPYANDLLNFYDSVSAIQVFYSLSVGGVGIFATAAWIYATQNRRLVDPELSDQTIRKVRQESYAEPLVALLAIGGALIHPFGWTVTFFVGLPLVFIVQAVAQKKIQPSP